MTWYGNSYEPGPRISLRLILAVLIALGGIIGYFTHTSINPVTGEKQHVSLSPAQEVALGLQSAPRMAAEMGGALRPDDPMQQLVSQVGMRVLHNSDAAKGPYTDNFHYIVLADDKTINAFALPGGQVFITRALLVRLKNEAQVAGVLGHETGHVIGRHTSEQMAKSELGRSLATAFVIGNDRDRTGGLSSAVIANTVNKMIGLHYSRADESEADQFGLQFMTEAGYNPNGMLGVMQVLLQTEQANGGHPPEFMMTHPLTQERIDAIKAWIAQHYPNGIPSSLTFGRELNFRRASRPQSDF
jgi:predicted Zn-dependent protease